MDRYKRNIKQIEDAGKCPLQYFLDKTNDECDELKEMCDFALEDGKEFFLKHWEKNLYGEIADVLNCINYLKILFGLDEDRISRVQVEKVDRGYERGLE